MTFRIETITSFDDPVLEPYRSMRRSVEQREQGIFVAEGEKLVRRLLESELTVVSVLLPEKWLESFRPLLERRGGTVRVYVAEKPLLESLTGFSMYQGLLAVGKIPALPSIEQAWEAAAKPVLFVALEGLTSAQNVGAVVRNAAAFGAHAIIKGETTTSPFLRRAVRSSMGAILEISVVEPASLREALRYLRAQGVRCVAAHPHASGKTITDANLAPGVCLIFGSEGYGLEPKTLELCDEAVAIAMAPAIDSLNVASASAVFLYEANRQRALNRPYPE